MNCPVCDRAVRDTDQECACGELLTTWTNLRRGGHALRQRGLVLAAAGDHVGATLSFLEAALTNPLDDLSLVDAARALVHLGRTEEALVWLKHAAARPGSRAAAAALLQAIEALPSRGPGAPAAAAGQDLAETTTMVATAPPPLLGLGALPRARRWLARAETDPLWEVVLRLEQEGAQDWRAPAPWLESALGTAKGHAVLQYMLGLGAWQRAEPEEAQRRFLASMEADAPVLNPAGYYLYLQAEDAPRGRAALERLRSKYAPQDVERCLRAVADRVKAWPESTRARVVRSLLADDAGRGA